MAAKGRTRAGVLDGLRIIEISAFIAAPLCGLTLSQLGADVIRIDPPGGNIDIDRAPLAPSGRSLYWASLNAGKRSVEIDFRNPLGQQLLGRMLAASGDDGGIVVTNLPLGPGLSYEALRALRQDLIMIRLNGSPDGRSEVDYTVNCAVGFPMITGTIEEPVNHVLPAWDAVAGLTLATALLAAERHRRKTGEGQLVTLSLSDVAMGMVSNLAYIADEEINKVPRQRDGNYLYGAFGHSFRTQDDRYVMIAALTDRQWASIVGAVLMAGQLEASAATLGHDLRTNEGRYRAREFIEQSLRPWFLQRPCAEIATTLARSRVLFGVYRDVAQMLSEDRRCSVDNPMFQRIEQLGIGPVLSAGTPLSFGSSERVAPRSAPTLGQHTQELLREMADVSAREYADLQAAGVLAPTAPR